MDGFSLYSLIVTIAIFIGYINSCLFKQQSTIAIMAGAIIVSIILIICHYFGLNDFYHQAQALVIRTHFEKLLLNSMLSFLLFAGALTIDIDSLFSQKWLIAVLATLSTTCSTFLVGFALWFIATLLHFTLPLITCLLFGALISPTDPIAVLAILSNAGMPKQLSTIVAGESLFNDGVGIVMFLTLLKLTMSNVAHHIALNAVRLFLQEALGGIIFGIILGWISSLLAKPLKEANAIILLTIGIVTAGYAIALQLDISGPLAMVVTGIFVNYKLHHNIPLLAFHELKKVWEVIDELLNAILFLLLGFELLNLHTGTPQIIIATIMIPVVLIIRLITSGIPILLFKQHHTFPAYSIRILTWGGLRGGLAVALALSLPQSPYRSMILTTTYAIVTFAIIVQGASMKKLALKSMNNSQTLHQPHPPTRA